MWKDVTLHIWIWISTFKDTGNRLPKHCNRLQPFENIWNVVNSVWKLFQTLLATGNRLQQYGNRLPESKNSLVKVLSKTHVLFKVLKKLFNTYLDWVFSSFLNLESWILILILEILNLESWFLSLDFLLESWILLDSYLELLNCSWFTWVVLVESYRSRVVR